MGVMKVRRNASRKQLHSVYISMFIGKRRMRHHKSIPAGDNRQQPRHCFSYIRGSNNISVMCGLVVCHLSQVGSGGRAVGIEHIPHLVDRSRKAIRIGVAGPMLETGSLSIHSRNHEL